MMRELEYEMVVKTIDFTGLSSMFIETMTIKVGDFLGIQAPTQGTESKLCPRCWTDAIDFTCIAVLRLQ